MSELQTLSYRTFLREKESKLLREKLTTLHQESLTWWFLKKQFKFKSKSTKFRLGL